jgi:hypothetical protein
MLILINASNHGKPLGNDTLKAVAGFGAHGIRTDIVPDGAESQLQEFREHDHLQLLALVMGGRMVGDGGTMLSEARHAARIAHENLEMGKIPHPPIFELGNEPTTGEKSAFWRKPENFGQAVAAAARAIWEIAPDALVVSGGIHNPGETTQGYLRRAAKHFPRPKEGNFAVGFHNYAPGMGDPKRAHKGFKNADDQVRRIQDLGYRLFDTESGGHTAAPENHSNEEVAGWLTDRLDLSLRWGLLGSVVFQLNDGPNPKNFEHTFGLLDKDGQEKPSGRALRDWTARNKA